MVMNITSSINTIQFFSLVKESTMVIVGVIHCILCCGGGGWAALPDHDLRQQHPLDY